MAIRAFTDQPDILLASFKEAVTAKRILSWAIDEDGDFYLTAEQWVNKAWMRARILDDRVLFNIIGTSSGKMSRTIYGVYHGRMVQTLLIRYDALLKHVTATALPTSGDQLPNG